MGWGSDLLGYTSRPAKGPGVGVKRSFWRDRAGVLEQRIECLLADIEDLDWDLACDRKNQFYEEDNA